MCSSDLRQGSSPTRYSKLHRFPPERRGRVCTARFSHPDTPAATNTRDSGGSEHVLDVHVAHAGSRLSLHQYSDPQDARHPISYRDSSWRYRVRASEEHPNSIHPSAQANGQDWRRATHQQSSQVSAIAGTWSRLNITTSFPTTS